ncbi:MAG TPA: hypothetical protein VK590_12410 [Saprospiraceae bacterium]|nr:hypothetical protein [Saprospiraceae bacterium]
MQKDQLYQKLIKKRKKFKFPPGIQNYSIVKKELNYVDTWETWHNNLDADIMVVGQDFADVKAFERDKGKIEPDATKFKYRTNENLALLFEEALDIEIGHPISADNSKKLFFTNALVGLKEGGMQGSVHPILVYKSAETFLKPLINIVQPKVIIALGILPFQVINAIYNFKLSPQISINATLKEIITQQFETPDHIKIFPVYHCGARGFNKRKKTVHLTDWKKIKLYLNTIKI